MLHGLFGSASPFGSVWCSRSSVLPWLPLRCLQHPQAVIFDAQGAPLQHLAYMPQPGGYTGSSLLLLGVRRCTSPLVHLTAS